MVRDDGRLLHTARHGHAKLDAYLDDYASLANSLVSLYEANFNERWIDEAVRLTDIMLKDFAGPNGGGFFYTAADHEQLIARNKELTDSSTPSGNALAATALLRLGRLLGRTEYLDAAEGAMAAALPIMQRAPTAAGQMLLALDRFVGPAHELVLVGDMAHDQMKNAIPAVQQRFLPRTVFAVRDSSSADPTGARSRHLEEIFASKESPNGEPRLYVCQNFACQQPMVGLAAIEVALDAIRGA
jgi:uncharacterized protein YyaL (SSP411 family)